MSKSLGNLVFVSDLRTEIDPRAIRLALMAHHYRSDFEWFDDEGPKAQTDLDLLIEACAIAEPLSEGQLMDEVREALDDDLNAPRARELLLESAQIIVNNPSQRHESCVAAAAALCGIEIR